MLIDVMATCMCYSGKILTIMIFYLLLAFISSVCCITDESHRLSKCLPVCVCGPTGWLKGPGLGISSVWRKKSRFLWSSETNLSVPLKQISSMPSSLWVYKLICACHYYRSDVWGQWEYSESFLCSTMPHLFDKKYSNIVSYYCNLWIW